MKSSSRNTRDVESGFDNAGAPRGKKIINRFSVNAWSKHLL